MPLPPTPAGALAQSIAAKQRTSNVFSDNAPLRRPSAYGADQQTRLFAGNLRTHTPRSPSVGRSSSSLASQPLERSQRNYMRATSSSRQRSRNAGGADHGVAAETPRQLHAPNNPSGSRVRSQSPYRAAGQLASTASLHALPRLAPLRQGPPLPRGRGAPPALQEGEAANRVVAGLRRQNSSVAGGSVCSWSIGRSHTSLLPVAAPPQEQQQQRKQGSLSSSWTVRDPLTSAGNAHADLVEADDGTLQLDASDQRELSQITASFERSGLFTCISETTSTREREVATSSRFNSAAAAAAATAAAHNAANQDYGFSARKNAENSSSEGRSLAEGLFRGSALSNMTEKSQQKGQGAPAYAIQALGQQQQQQELQQQQIRQQQQPQQEQLRSWPRPPQPQEEASSVGGGGLNICGRGFGHEPPGGDTRPCAASSFFGGGSFASVWLSPCGDLWHVMGRVGWCFRFAVVLIVCLWRLLNTSYDSWSARQFRQDFSDMLAGREPPVKAPFLACRGSLNRGSGAAAALTPEGLLERVSAGSTTQRQQKQQNTKPYLRRSSAAARSSLGSVHPRDKDAALTAARGYGSSCTATEGRPVSGALSLLKAFSIALSVVGLFCWLLLTADPKEEFVDFDFM
ncbi:hypothetical protein, conserved [Eimeria tenella]|uniref:Uncharacterized protein n=1 Tax=Eimeria tenella TaxID=5802 RepID=U6KSB4_EIMTE|nr:hypothetical protein, conserved [Eimeria tenella]CDJ40982.1 hypothetical protein, conserved [Eimeria tenella]|eukprot:XP_013231732.1 hypothetical protein, conserved [Eimeria tenella]